MRAENCCRGLRRPGYRPQPRSQAAIRLSFPWKCPPSSTVFCSFCYVHRRDGFLPYRNQGVPSSFRVQRGGNRCHVQAWLGKARAESHTILVPSSSLQLGHHILDALGNLLKSISTLQDAPIKKGCSVTVPGSAIISLFCSEPAFMLLRPTSSHDRIASYPHQFTSQDKNNSKV